MSNVLPFPQTARAIGHYNSGMDAAGLLSLLLLDRDGEPPPENVRRFDNLDVQKEPIAQSPELMLALLAWGALPKKKRDSIRSTVRCEAYGSRAGPAAVGLHNLLSRSAW
jgi:hypothetical protein